MAVITETQALARISELKTFWNVRNKKFKEWFSILNLVDTLSARRMESYVSNEPQTFYNMAHYLLTKGELSHSTPVESESAAELDRVAKINRGCTYVWSTIDRERQLGGSQPFVDELGFFVLVLGWYSSVFAYDGTTGGMKAQVWSPMDTFPEYSANRIASCVHSYTLTESEAIYKASLNDWKYVLPSGATASTTKNVTLNDYFMLDDNGILQNMIFIDNKNVVSGWIPREDMKLLISPVAGFPNRGSLDSNWKPLMGRSIFEVNAAVTLSFNKWKTMVAQILRDTAQPITQEFSATPQATTEQLRERGALFHYGMGEGGIQRLPPPAIPIEIQASLLELRREQQKGSFNDSVYGMVEGQPGYALSQLASSSANQILYPYMDAKHFVISEADRFWLSNLKRTGMTFQIKGKFLEQISPMDVPEDVNIVVDSKVATPKDMMERGTVAGMISQYVDRSTIITDVLGYSDPQGIHRRKSVDDMLDHPMSKMVEMIAGYTAHADYLQYRGDLKQAALFRRAATALEGQLGVPPAGSAAPAQETIGQVEQGAPEKKTPVNASVMPPENRGFSPQVLRNSIGKGKIKAV